MRAAYVCSRGSLPHDPEVEIVRAAWAAAGIESEVVEWRDPRADWSAFDVAVVRSCWDYHLDRDRFLAWADSVGRLTRLINPAGMLRRNTHKSYLLALADAGVATVPTRLFRPGERPLAWEGPQVVKPAVSAGARDTFLMAGPADAEQQALDLLVAGREVLLQPYLPEVETTGEISVVCFNGVASHAARKVPPLTEGGHGGADRLVELSAGLSAAAAAVLATEPEPPLYARVDLVEVDGRWLLMELELTEPCLFTNLAPDSADRFAEALSSRFR